TPVHTTLSFTRFNVPGFELGAIGWGLVAVGMILATSNAVNLTDGLDGLAAGSSIYAFISYMVIGFWGFRHSATGGTGPDIYHLVHSYDLAIVAAAMLGACAGFLWWNANPARIIMGDTGSLAIGTGLAALALTTSTALLLPIVGGLFVLETLSVIIQVAAFRLFGRRVFRMAPIHHHFELGGWPETTVIVRFWILAGLFTALALGFYYADFLRFGTLD
ncbi:MAG: phospho-N-acetylmuramoyl-pentapeptide-transferase, partial [Acidimicrobiaceae bacterium]